MFHRFSKYLRGESISTNTEDLRYNDSVCYQGFCCKIEFGVINLIWTRLKHE